MNRSLKIGKFEIFWLQGGEFFVDGGAMFGAVPKALWSKKCPADGDNCIKLLNNVLLLKTEKANILIDTGLGNKLNDKQKKIFKVRQGWDLQNDLRRHGLGCEDIDYVILTHCDFDHAGGIVSLDERGIPALTFSRAKHIIQKKEWQDVISPNIRSINTYWPDNFSELSEHSLQIVDGSAEIIPGVTVELTGGHTRGHQLVIIESEGQCALHLGDLLPTRHHLNPLWNMAYDNFPMEVIFKKEEYLKTHSNNKTWLTSYHDTEFLAFRLDQVGEISETI